MNSGREHPEDGEASGVRACEFAKPSPLQPDQLRELRKDQEKFVRSLADVLSHHLRLEFSLELKTLQTVSFQKLAQDWANPSHFTLFKTEPLRGVSVLEMPPRLGMAIVDRLMGGRGEAAEAVQEISEIEQALLEPTVQMLLEEWCAQWSGVKELKPSILGCESNGRFIQIATPDTMMLVLEMEAALGEYQGGIQISFPFSTLEPLLGHLKQSVHLAPAAQASVPVAACKWNTCFDEVRVPVTAEWEGLELPSRAILDLKIGDFVQMNPQSAQQVSVRLAGLPKFHGRPGTIAGQWAVELTQAIKP